MAVNRPRVLASVALVVVAVLGVQTWSKAFRPGGNDLTSYLLSARAIWDGHSPYGLDTPFPYIYPLFLAFGLIPLAFLPYGVAVAGWFAASVAALALAVRRLGAVSALGAAVALVVTFSAIQNTLLNGQVNFLVLLCCVLAVIGARARKETAAGAWLGMGTAVKLMPAVLGVYLLVRRQFRAAVLAGATAVALAVVPALLIDRSVVDLYSQFLQELQMSVATVPEGGVLTYSVSGLIQQIFGASPSLRLDLLCAAAVIGAVAVIDVWIWRPRGDDLAAGAAYLSAIVLISPKSETHHLVFTIPAVALAFGEFFREAGRLSRFGAVLLLSSAAFIAAPLLGIAEGPAITVAVALLIGALSCGRQRS